MKIFATCIMVWIAAMFMNINGTNISTNPDSSVPPSLNGKTWKMEVNATWVDLNNGTKTFYRIRKKETGGTVLLVSHDSATWTFSPARTWRDRHGELIRLGKDSRLEHSVDNGTNWKPLEGSIWQDGNEEWFMLEKDASIWKMEK